MKNLPAHLTSLLLFTGLMFVLPFPQLKGQCDVDVFASSVDVVCGDTVRLNALGNGITVFEEDFNDNDISGWANTPSGSFETNVCGVPSPDNSVYYWFGGSANSPRFAETPSLDLSTGGTICFDMRYSYREGGPDCEDPDAPDEGVHLQYSINNGATWQDIAYWDPGGRVHQRFRPTAIVGTPVCSYSIRRHCQYQNPLGPTGQYR